MATSSGGERHVTFLLDNVPAQSTVTDDRLVELIGGKVESAIFRFQGKVLMRAIFSEEEYEQFQENRFELENIRLTLEKQWLYPIKSQLLFTGLPPRVSTDTLEVYLEAKHDVSVKKITLSDDKTAATVELMDTSMIPYLTLKEHVIKKQSVSVEEIPFDDGIDKQIPYLKVSGLPQRNNVDKLLKTTFCNRLSSKDMNALGVTLLDNGEAAVDFKCVDDCKLLAGEQHELLGKPLAVQLCYKALEETSLQNQPLLFTEEDIPYLKVSGFPEDPDGIEELLRETFLNKLPSTMSHGDINVQLTSTGEAIVEFESHQDCFYLANMNHSFLGKKLHVELCHKSAAAAPIIAEVLVIRGLPDIPDVQQAMEFVLQQKTMVVVDKFVLEKDTAYIMFTDSSGVTEVMCDPVKEFFGSLVDCSVVNEEDVDVFPDSVPKVLLVKGLPDRFSSKTLEHYLRLLFKNAGQPDVSTCIIENSEAYVKFDNPAAVRKLVNNPPENGCFLGKPTEYFSVPETEMPDSTPHKLIVKGLSNTRRHLVLSLKDYFENFCNVSPVSIEMNDDEAVEVKFADLRAAKRIATSPPAELFLGYTLQFTSVRDISCVSVPLSPLTTLPLTDTVMVEGLPDNTNENAVCNSLKQLGLPLPMKLFIGKQSAYLQFSTAEDVSNIIGNPSAKMLLGRPVSYKAMCSDDIPPSSQFLLQQCSSEPAKQSMSDDDVEDETDAVLSGTKNIRSREVSGEYSQNVVVRGLPHDIKVEDFLLEMYMQTIAGIEPSSVNIGGPIAVVEFAKPVDVKAMRQKALDKPFPVGHTVVHIQVLERSNKVLVTGVPSSMPENVIDTYFERLGLSVVSKEKRSEETFVVTFKDHTGLDSVLAQDHKVGNHVLSVSNFHSVLDELDKYKEPPPAPKPVYEWVAIETVLDSCQMPFVEHYLSAFLNKQLQGVHAKGKINGQTLIVEPLQNAFELHNWEEEVKKLIDECLSDFTTAEQELDKAAVIIVWKKIKAFKEEHTDLHYDPGDNSVKVSGRSTTVNAVLQLISDVTETEVEVTKTLKLPTKHIKFLLKFHRSEIGAIKPRIQIAEEPMKLVVTGVKRSLDCLEALVREKLQLAHEQVLPLSSTAYKLLTSRRGVAKLEEILQQVNSLIVYTVEKANGGGQLIVIGQQPLSSKVAIDDVRRIIIEKKITLTPERQRICTGDNHEWRSFIEEHSKEHFLTIKVVGNEIVVVGEAIIVTSIVKNVEELLSEQTAVTIAFELPRAKWQVIRDFRQSKIKAIQKDRPNVQWTWPKSDAEQAKMVSIDLRGDPLAVEHTKGMLESLSNEVFLKDIKLSPKPGLKQVMDTVEFRRHEILKKHDAVIEIELTELPQHKVRGRQARLRSNSLIKASTLGGVRVKVVTGAFASEKTDVLVNFVTETPDFHSPVLSTLVKVGGDEVRRSLQQLSRLLHGTAHVCSHGTLPCSLLVHVVVPTYSISSSTFENVLSEALPQIVQFTSQYRKIVITPLTASPFNCPVNLYAEKVLEALDNMSLNDDADISVFVENPSCKQEFEEKMNANNYHIFPPMQTEHKTASYSPTENADLNHSLQKAVKIIKGSILEVKADVYVNSTNPELDMSKGELSRAFLQACGAKMQEEAKHYRPLAHGQVAVTSARNLKAKSIYHVSLPDYRSPGSVTKYRETIKTILRTAQGEGVSSIAIPSLGVANLNYPSNIAAEILFDEVVSFHAQNRTAIQSFTFVIFRDEDHKVFKQEHEARVTRAASLIQSSSAKNSKDLKVFIVNGDISDEQSSDVIVNSTSVDMALSATRISHSISKKAGPNMQTLCSSFVQAGVTLKDARIISHAASGSLKCHKVYHACVEKKKQGTPATANQTQLVKAVTENSLCRAEEDRVTSISLPVFCLGEGGYSVTESGHPMLEAIQEFTQKSPKFLNEIRIVILDDKMFNAFKEVFFKFFPSDLSLSSRGRSWSPRQLFEHMPKKEGVSIAITQKSQTSQAQHTQHYQPNFQVEECGATIHIYYTESIAIDQIEQKLKEIIDENIKTDTVDLENLTPLLGKDDIDELFEICHQKCVSVNLQRKMQRLLIEGEVTAVDKARIQIEQKLLEFRKITTELLMYEWSCINEEDHSRISYLPEVCFQLEKAYQRKLSSVETVVEDLPVVISLQDSTMTETDNAGIQRVVKREKKSTFTLPSSWTTQPTDDKGNPKVCAYVDVMEGTTEYTEATQHFKQTLGKSKDKVTISRVQRIQNPGEYMRYEALKTSWRQTTGADVKEEMLFHGTKKESLDQICQTGFNRIFAAEANAACFGKGVYFARNSGYSVHDKYSAPDSSGEKNILVCSLLVSQITKGTADMKIAPKIQGKDVPFDTLVDNTSNPTIFVAMRDSQVYPNYLIQFKIAK